MEHVQRGSDRKSTYQHGGINYNCVSVQSKAVQYIIKNVFTCCQYEALDDDDEVCATLKSHNEVFQS